MSREVEPIRFCQSFTECQSDNNTLTDKCNSHDNNKVMCVHCTVGMNKYTIIYLVVYLQLIISCMHRLQMSVYSKGLFCWFRQ